MPEINLLPIDLSQNSDAVQSNKTIKKIIITLSGVFLLIVVIGMGIIVLFNNQLNDSLERQNSLKAEIQKLENVEQKLVLIKDRINKITTAQGEIDTSNALTTLNPVVTSLPQNVKLDTIEVSNDGSMLFTVFSDDSVGMATFLNSIVSSGVYKELSLNEFVFEPNNGYKITLTNP